MIVDGRFIDIWEPILIMEFSELKTIPNDSLCRGDLAIRLIITTIRFQIHWPASVIGDGQPHPLRDAFKSFLYFEYFEAHRTQDRDAMPRTLNPNVPYVIGMEFSVRMK
jgi:hypothetical protein